MLMRPCIAIAVSLVGIAAGPDAPPDAGTYIHLSSTLTVEWKIGEVPAGIPYSRLNCTTLTGSCTYTTPACETLSVEARDETKIVVTDRFKVKNWFAWTNDPAKKKFYPQIFTDIGKCLDAIEPKGSKK